MCIDCGYLILIDFLLCCLESNLLFAIILIFLLILYYDFRIFRGFRVVVGEYKK